VITCKRAAELISHAEEAPLGRWRAFQLRLHLLLCAMCGRFRRQVHLLRRAGCACDDAAAHPKPTLSEEARERMKRAIREQGRE
jgi:hypothetical protein